MLFNITATKFRLSAITALVTTLALTNSAVAIPISISVPQPASSSCLENTQPELDLTTAEYTDSPKETLPTSPFLQRQRNLQFFYSANQPPLLAESSQLQSIVNQIVQTATAKHLKTQPLSITLIDLNKGQVAGYQQNQFRYPASVVKLFWLVALYGEFEQGILTNKAAFQPYIRDMIGNSDNDAASVILDQITATQSWSKSQLTDVEFQSWLTRRNQVNCFFKKAGYQGINIDQKTYPVDYLHLSSPKGTELRMRGNSQAPIRNQITSQQAARLMYEVVNNQAVSPSASQKMSTLLTRDLNPQVWRNIYPDFNPIEGFFGESLPSNIKFVSKAGWTSGSRNEVAFVQTPDGKTRYVLAIFADSSAYASDDKIFPEMSRLVFDQMNRQ
ncbi:hypothetical protein Cri9333_1329 [Crinalium epipsammum PCC 9333]|uniref:Beta-lactamase class A catalytic domain-containing protein n=1 Tax=Crinalium epipsammum PCC 9333 TaxID=1173022 RepID=K9VW78_9CYAN|nr:serine hydrolase [Crinalium epipsammum]AFZ12226.1 hypothetical protein Cri9333_1329 [Crinalium epipsammum PCC 9333]